MKVLTRTLSTKQYVAETFQRVIESMTTDTLRAHKTQRFAIAVDAPEPPPDLNAAIRAARQVDEPVAAADVNGVPAPPSLNASIMKFLKKGFVR